MLRRSDENANDQILLPSGYNPFTTARLLGSGWCVFLWYRNGHTDATIRTPVYAEGSWGLRVDTSSNRITMRNFSGTLTNRHLNIAGLAENTTDLWLFAVSVDDTDIPTTAPTSTLFAYNLTTGAILSSSTLSHPNAFADDATSFGLGGEGITYPANGDVGLVVVRNHQITLADFTAVAETRRYTAPVYSTAGGMTGHSGVVVAMNHGVLPSVSFGANASTNNFPAFDAAENNSWVDNPSGVTVSGNHQHINPYDAHPLLERWPVFGATLPENTTAGTASAAISQALMSARPTTLNRVMGVGNSRGVRRVSYDAGPQNFLMGLARFKPEWLGGVDCVLPADTSTNPWPFIDWTNAASGAAASYNNYELENTTNLTRFGQNRQSNPPSPAVRKGNGPVGKIASGGHYRSLAKPDGNVAATDPIVSSHILLAYPGSRNASSFACASTGQGAANVTTGTPFATTLDTEEANHTLVSADTKAVTGVTLDGVTGLGLEENWCVYNATKGEWTTIATVNESGGDTVITFTHNIDTAPANGDVLRFGPWAYVRASVTNAGDETNTWRGIRTEYGSTGGDGPVCVIGLGAWRASGWGNIYTTIGGGAMGFVEQLSANFPLAIERLVETLDPAVCILTPATQSSSFANLQSYKNRVLAGKAETEIVYGGDQLHASAGGADGSPSLLTNWNAAMLSNAEADGAFAVDASRSARIGMIVDQVCGGQRHDSAHPSSLGMDEVAREWAGLTPLGAATSGRSAWRSRNFRGMVR